MIKVVVAGVVTAAVWASISSGPVAQADGANEVVSSPPQVVVVPANPVSNFPTSPISVAPVLPEPLLEGWEPDNSLEGTGWTEEEMRNAKPVPWPWEVSKDPAPSVGQSNCQGPWLCYFSSEWNILNVFRDLLARLVASLEMLIKGIWL